MVTEYFSTIARVLVRKTIQLIWTPSNLATTKRLTLALWFTHLMHHQVDTGAPKIRSNDTEVVVFAVLIASSLSLAEC